MSNQIQKRCTKCLRTKYLAEFVKVKRNKDGHGAWCKKCLAKHNKQYTKQGINRWTVKLDKYSREMVRGYLIMTGDSLTNFVNDAIWDKLHSDDLMRYPRLTPMELAAERKRRSQGRFGRQVRQGIINAMKRRMQGN